MNSEISGFILIQDLFLPKDHITVSCRGQQAAIKVQLQQMPNGPIRTKQVDQSSSVIG